MAIEQFSQTWRDVKHYVEERIAELQVRLEAPVSNDETVSIRGQLRELRLILDLPNKDIPLTEPIDLYLPE